MRAGRVSADEAGKREWDEDVSGTRMRMGRGMRMGGGMRADEWEAGAGGRRQAAHTAGPGARTGRVSASEAGESERNRGMRVNEWEPVGHRWQAARTAGAPTRVSPRSTPRSSITA